MVRMCLVVRRGFLVLLLVSFWGVLIVSSLRSAWSMWIWLGNQDASIDPAKKTDGAYRCQMVPNGATLVLLPPVTTGSEEDPGTPAGRLDPGFSPASRGRYRGECCLCCCGGYSVFQNEEQGSRWNVLV